MNSEPNAAQGPVDGIVRPSEFNPARALNYPDFNEDGHALAAGPFKCPECGGWTFGSSIGKTGKAEKGYCHDAHGIGCNFQWDRADDRKYFATSRFDGGPNALAQRTGAEGDRSGAATGYTAGGNNGETNAGPDANNA